MDGAEVTQAPSMHLARSIVLRMGETGQPPERGALHVNTGTEDVLRVLRQEYLLPMKESGRNSSFKLVQATFGGGKTHFLHCLREVGWAEGFASSLVSVSPQECPFDDTVRVYQAVARELELPPTELEAAPQRGFDAVLRLLVDQRVETYGEEAFRRWLQEEFRRANIESHAVRRAALLYMEGLLDRDPDQEELMADFLLGASVPKKELAPFRIREELESRTAFRFLRSLVQTLRALEVPGVLLLFDEMDRVMSLTVKRRKSIGDNLRQMIDHCGQALLPCLLWVYAVPPEFMTTVVPEYPALEQRLRGAAILSDTSVLAPLIDLERLALTESELFEGIGMRLCDLMGPGEFGQLNRELQQENVRLLARHMAETTLESGARRTFVKRAVQMLRNQIQDERALTRDDVEQLDLASGGSPFLDGEEDIF